MSYVSQIKERGRLLPGASTPTYEYQGGYYNPEGFLLDPESVQRFTPTGQVLDRIYGENSGRIAGYSGQAEELLSSLFPGFQAQPGMLGGGIPPNVRGAGASAEAAKRDADTALRGSNPRDWFQRWAQAALQQDPVSRALGVGPGGMYEPAGPPGMAREQIPVPRVDGARPMAAPVAPGVGLSARTPPSVATKGAGVGLSQRESIFARTTPSFRRRDIGRGIRMGNSRDLLNYR
jgi:hypothetical protein